MLTIHGIHEWDIVPGLLDTGGQNVFVNQFSQALADHGLKITIANRGGYPHPLSEENREGYHYKDENQRILYLEDGLNRFVRKEDMAASVLDLVASLKENLDNKSTPIDLIVSHYWDAGKVGSLYNQSLEPPAKHIWIPHSLGTIKKENVSAQLGADLKLDQRIGLETEIIQVIDSILVRFKKMTLSGNFLATNHAYHRRKSAPVRSLRRSAEWTGPRGKMY